MECVGFLVEDIRQHLAKSGLPDDPSEPAHVITAQLLRTLPIGRLTEEMRREKAEAAGAIADTLLEEGQDEAYAHHLQERSRRFKAEAAAGGRRPMYDREHYCKVANVYYRAWRKGDPPTQAVADYFTVSYSTAARWVRECRKPQRGLLGPTRRGKAGGVLPPEEKEDTS